jgi:hypothetical protein
MLVNSSSMAQTPLTPADIARSDREFLRSQECARMSERLQIWALFATLASGFGFVVTQNGEIHYLTLLFPVLLMFLSMHVRNSEDTLKQIRKYLYKQEQVVGYEGYEHFSRDPANTRQSHGGYKKALRGAFCTTGALAVGGVVLHMVLSHVAVWVVLVVVITESAVIASTWCRLSSWKKWWWGVTR